MRINLSMKLFWVVILLCIGGILADDDATVTETPKKNVTVEKEKDITESTSQTICDPCKCSKTTTEQIFDCSGLKMLNILSNDKWTELNKTIEISDARFTNNGITKVTALPRLNIRFLSFKGNEISEIVASAFIELPELEVLDLSENKLTFESLRPNIFQGKYDPLVYEPLKKLKVLNLGKNRIHSLDEDIFEHLPSLEVLTLNDNAFKVIDQSASVAISTIPLLKVLDMSFMELKELPEHLFHTPKHLENLYVQGNLFTKLPAALTHATSLKRLTLDENPIENLEFENIFPKLENLEFLSISGMEHMKVIGDGALSGLTGLKVLYCKNNPHLSKIHENALSRPGGNGNRLEEWPNLKELYLNNNNLSILENHLVARWDRLDIIDIRTNPFQCDCENQWVIDELMPMIMKESTEMSQDIVCNHPIEMIGIELLSLQQKGTKMRCSDQYGNRPERDGTILIGILLGVLIGIPITLGLLLIYRRGCCGLFGYSGPGPADYSRAFYKRADLHDDLRVHI